MDKIHKICNRCGDRHCCRGLCKEMNEYLVKDKKKKKSKGIG